MWTMYTVHIFSVSMCCNCKVWNCARLICSCQNRQGLPVPHRSTYPMILRWWWWWHKLWWWWGLPSKISPSQITIIWAYAGNHIITVGFFQNLNPTMLYWSCQFDDWNLKIVKFIFLSFTQTAGPGDFQCTQTPKQECSEKKCSYCTSL